MSPTCVLCDGGRGCRRERSRLGRRTSDVADVAGPPAGPTVGRAGTRTRSGPRLRRSRLVVSAVAVAALVAAGVLWQVAGARDPVVGSDQYLRVTTRALAANVTPRPDGTPASWLETPRHHVHPHRVRDRHRRCLPPIQHAPRGRSVSTPDSPAAVGPSPGSESPVSQAPATAGVGAGQRRRSHVYSGDPRSRGPRSIPAPGTATPHCRIVARSRRNTWTSRFASPPGALGCSGEITCHRSWGRSSSRPSGARPVSTANSSAGRSPPKRGTADPSEPGVRPWSRARARRPSARSGAGRQHPPVPRRDRCCPATGRQALLGPREPSLGRVFAVVEAARREGGLRSRPSRCAEHEWPVQPRGLGTVAFRERPPTRRPGRPGERVSG